MGEPTKEELDGIVEDFRTKFDEVKKQPAELNDQFDNLKWVWPQAYWAYTDVRDEAQANLKKLIKKLEEVAEGIAAPFLFIDYAAKWQVVGSAVSRVNGIQSRPALSMEGHWEGTAYTKFKESRTYQSTAMTNITEMCQKVHTELLALAAEGRSFYKQIIDKLATLLAQLALALGEIASIAGAPWGIDKFNDAIVTAVELVAGTVTSFFELQSKVFISSNELKNIVNRPAGFPTGTDGKDHWPESVADGFDDKKEWKLAE
ncbi:hypothetical protein AB0B25_03850 [Nocardia sp. NPDC049190]|uniref:hypothetical protein n=1 Tax=Nocardia sp. NPDC049190 TaxID=3155650 RepID=UPI0033C77D35